jgi:hypothetical protein
VVNNPFDCGITLASHALYSKLPAGALRGVDHNTTSDNDSSKNGLAGEGAGAGVGIFVAGAGLEATGNVVTRNRLTGNGLPGVAFHLHTALPGQNLSVAPITGIVIVQNVIKDEAVDIAANTPTLVEVHFNNLLGKQMGVDNLDDGAVNATANWWGCAKGPGSPGCTSVSRPNVVSTPFLTRPADTSSPE